MKSFIVTFQSSYVCTLPNECFEKIEKDFVADMEGVHEHNDEALHLATASKLVLTSEAVANIKLFLEKRKTTKVVKKTTHVK